MLLFAFIGIRFLNGVAATVIWCLVYNHYKVVILLPLNIIILWIGILVFYGSILHRFLDYSVDNFQLFFVVRLALLNIWLLHFFAYWCVSRGMHDSLHVLSILMYWFLNSINIYFLSQSRIKSLGFLRSCLRVRLKSILILNTFRWVLGLWSFGTRVLKLLLYFGVDKLQRGATDLIRNSLVFVSVLVEFFVRFRWHTVGMQVLWAVYVTFGWLRLTRRLNQFGNALLAKGLASFNRLLCLLVQSVQVFFACFNSLMNVRLALGLLLRQDGVALSHQDVEVFGGLVVRVFLLSCFDRIHLTFLPFYCLRSQGIIVRAFPVLLIL